LFTWPQGNRSSQGEFFLMKNAEFKIENISFPRLLLGSSPWIGAGQFGEKALEYYQRFYLQPENITELIVHFVRNCAPSLHLCLMEPLVKAVLEAEKLLGQRLPLIATLFAENQHQQLEWIKQLQVKVLMLHAQTTDRLYRRELEQFCSFCRAFGIIPGFATHNPGITIPRIDEMELDFPVYLAPLNPSGAHVHPDLPSALKAIKETPKTVIGMKTLRAGEIPPRAAFAFALERVEGIAVGMTEKAEIEENRELFQIWLES